MECNEYEKDLIQLLPICPKANDCKNNQCILRQQQVFGLHCWAAGYKEFYHQHYKKYKLSGTDVHLMIESHSDECINPHDESKFPSGVVELSALRDKIYTESGPQIYPKFELAPYGTNRNGIKCKDFK